MTVSRFTTIYCTRDDFKARAFPAGDASTADDATIEAVLEVVSRLIDTTCGHHFYPRVATKYFSAEAGEYLVVDSLLAIASLKTDDGGRTYGTTWATTDYDLYPYNALLQQPPKPYTEIQLSPNGNQSFPTTAKGVEIAGTWGAYQVLRTPGATVSGNQTDTDTSLEVSAGTDFDVGHILLIGSEQLRVTAISVNTLTVVRGVNGTTAAAITTGAGIQVHDFPLVGEACFLQALRLFKRKDAPFGIMGSEALGQLRAITKLDPDVESLLWPVNRSVAQVGAF